MFLWFNRPSGGRIILHGLRMLVGDALWVLVEHVVGQVDEKYMFLVSGIVTAHTWSQM